MDTVNSQKQMSNSSSISQFLLLPFADTQELQLLHFWLFLAISLAALLGNSLIITVIDWNHHLHTPMYSFLLNLSLLNLETISITFPKAMTNSFWDTKEISYMGCTAQVSLYVFFISSEHYLLTVMACDRYVAICKPLHYRNLLGIRAFVHMAAAAWDRKLGFLCTVTFPHLKPHSFSSPSLDVVVAVLYLVVPPAVILLFYSLRNQELNYALKKLIQSVFFQQQSYVFAQEISS
ncbi:PREDICTED: olfactory receptor 14C36-like, partial [Mesitornis unicolor]|uniref:olfactory receptor 14C36-like n=1 Tax=Mesitornis unicolor TaxID=54374 RepID=UPI000528A0B7